MNNNLILDKKNIIKIPQNEKIFLEIIKSKDWNNTIDILINIKEKIDYINLYITIKSYLLSIAFPFIEITINIKKKDDVIITERINSSIIAKMSFHEFQKWSQHRINYDLKYLCDDSFYCFSIISNSSIIKSNDLSIIKPIYPWKISVLNEIKQIENKDLVYEKIISKKKKEIILLKKKIRYLQLKKKWFTY